MSNRIEPKPCPFCGSDPVYRSARFDLYGLTGTLGCENPSVHGAPANRDRGREAGDHRHVEQESQCY